MLTKYQRIWEGSSLTTPANGVIVFYPLNDGVIKQIWLRVQNPVTHPLRWAIYYGEGHVYVTDFRIEIGEVLSGATLPDGFTVEMFQYLRLDLIETNGGIANIPVVIEYAIEEEIDISYNDLQDVPTSFPSAWDDVTGKPSTFPPSTHNHDDRYFTETESDARFAALSHNHDSRYYTETEIDSQASNYELLVNKNAVGGYAGLDGSGKVAAAQLPSYVDDVIEVANFAALPLSGETGKIYITVNNSKEYRWSGSVYVELVPSPGSTDAVPEGSTNKYFTEARVRTTPLTGLSLVSDADILSTDTVLEALGKLQAQLDGGSSGEVAWQIADQSFSATLDENSYRTVNTNISAFDNVTLVIPDAATQPITAGVFELAFWQAGTTFIFIDLPSNTKISLPNRTTTSPIRVSSLFGFTSSNIGFYLKIRYIGLVGEYHEWVAESLVGDVET